MFQHQSGYFIATPRSNHCASECLVLRVNANVKSLLQNNFTLQWKCSAAPSAHSTNSVTSHWTYYSLHFINA